MFLKPLLNMRGLVMEMLVMESLQLGLQQKL